MPGRNNWAKLTYDGKPNRTLSESVTITFTEKTDRLISFKQACTESAQEIFDTYKNLYVSMSGGCDSEHVANTFYNNGLPFTPIIVKLEEYNSHDIKYAFEWCKQKNIKPVVIEEKLVVWLKNLAELQIQDRNRMCWGMHNVYISDYVKKLGGHLVTGCCDLQKLPDHRLQQHYPELCEKFPEHFVHWETDYGMDQHDPGYHPGGFFIWKPEMVISWLNERNMAWSNLKAKWVLYDVPPRPKYVGHENVDWKNKFNKIVPVPQKIRKILGKHDWILLGTNETLWQDIYAGKKPA